jgi:hypothetical protein
MCEAGGVDSIGQTDRIVSRQPFLESMTTMAALAGRTRRMRLAKTALVKARCYRRRPASIDPIQKKAALDMLQSFSPTRLGTGCETRE